MKKSIDSNNCKIVYDVYNSDKAVIVVLIHGYGINRKIWDKQIVCFSEQKVIVPDVRAHGESRPCMDFTIPKAAQDIFRILEEEGSKKAIIIGLSMGGFIAQEFANLYPDSVAGMVVVGATPLFMKYPLWERISMKHSARLLSLFPWNYFKSYMSRYSAINEQARKVLYEMFSQMSKKEFIKSWNGIATSLHYKDIRFHFSLMFIYGENDKSGTIKLHIKDWKMLYPECIIERIKNASHVANIDNPNDFNNLLLEFIKTCE